jgi:hypothetical protein
MEIWTTLTRYNMDRITKEEAKSVILNIGLKPIETYVQCIQRDYAKIMEPDKKPKRGKRAEMKIFIDEAMDIPKEVVEELVKHKIEQPEVAEPVALEPVHEVVIEKENE